MQNFTVCKKGRGTTSVQEKDFRSLCNHTFLRQINKTCHSSTRINSIEHQTFRSRRHYNRRKSRIIQLSITRSKNCIYRINILGSDARRQTHKLLNVSTMIGNSLSLNVGIAADAYSINGLINTERAQADKQSAMGHSTARRNYKAIEAI